MQAVEDETNPKFIWLICNMEANQSEWSIPPKPWRKKM